MKLDAFARLCAADPAAQMPEATDHDRKQLRRAIVATPADAPRATQQRAHRRTRRRQVLVAVAAGALALLGATAVHAANWVLEPWPSGPQPTLTGREWKAEYEAWTHKIPLPAGAEWRGLGDQADTDTLVPASEGQVHATVEAMGDWAREWAAAAAAGDDQRAATAEDWVVRLRGTIPTTPPNKDGRLEEGPSVDKAYAANMDMAIAKGREGEFDWLISTLADGYAPSFHPTNPYAFERFSAQDPSVYSSPDEILWIEYGPLDAAQIDAEQGQAQYEGVLATVGLPRGVAVSNPPGGIPSMYLGVPGAGFEFGWAAAWSAWCSEWVAAAKAGAEERVAVAAAATAHLLDLLPQQARCHLRGDAADGVIKWTVEARCLRKLRHITTQARDGDLTGIQEWLDYQTSAERKQLQKAGAGS